jgi:hypothetical protein
MLAMEKEGWLEWVNRRAYQFPALLPMVKSLGQEPLEQALSDYSQEEAPVLELVRLEICHVS